MPAHADEPWLEVRVQSAADGLVEQSLAMSGCVPDTLATCPRDWGRC